MKKMTIEEFWKNAVAFYMGEVGLDVFDADTQSMFNILEENPNLRQQIKEAGGSVLGTLAIAFCPNGNKTVNSKAKAVVLIRAVTQRHKYIALTDCRWICWWHWWYWRCHYVSMVIIKPRNVVRLPNPPESYRSNRYPTEHGKSYWTSNLVAGQETIEECCV